MGWPHRAPGPPRRGGASGLDGVGAHGHLRHSPRLWWEWGRRDGLSAEGKGTGRSRKKKAWVEAALTLAVFKTRPGTLACESQDTDAFSYREMAAVQWENMRFSRASRVFFPSLNSFI